MKRQILECFYCNHHFLPTEARFTHEDGEPIQISCPKCEGTNLRERIVESGNVFGYPEESNES